MASSAVSDEVMVDASSKAQAPVVDGTGGSDDYFAFDASLCTATEAEAAAKAWCDATGAAASDVEGGDGAAAGGVDVVNALLASGAGDPEAAGEARSQQYERVRYLGEGQYARVYQYLHKPTGRLVAIKRIHRGKYRDGINVAAVCEIQVLQELRGHPNIIEMLDVYHHKERIHCVLEHCHGDLEQLINDKSVPLPQADIKSYMQMLLRGLDHCHKCFFLHRDLKTNNLMLGDDGQLKLIDFGMARAFGSPHHKLNHQVVTIWYRAPELLFGAREYDVGVDMWAVGCIMAELMRRDAFFKGTSELDQLSKIFDKLGTPTTTDWPGLDKLPCYLEFTPSTAKPWHELVPGAPADALDLLRKLLAWNPSERITCAEALKHPYFSNDPKPTPPKALPRPGTTAAAAPAPAPPQPPSPPPAALVAVSKRLAF